MRTFSSSDEIFSPQMMLKLLFPKVAHDWIFEEIPLSCCELEFFQAF